MYIGVGIFAVLAIIAVIAGTVTIMRRRNDYGDSDVEGEMGEAEFRRYEGFDD